MANANEQAFKDIMQDIQSVPINGKVELILLLMGSVVTAETLAKYSADPKEVGLLLQAELEMYRPKKLQ